MGSDTTSSRACLGPSSDPEQRTALLGLLALAVLAWALPWAVGQIGRAAPRPVPVIYAVGEPARLLWSPPGSFEAPERQQGRFRLADGTPGEPLGGWQGLLLGNPLDLNRATTEDLVALPGIGPKLAQAIAGTRSKLGWFHRVDDLLEVPGIGPKTLARLRPLLRAGPLEPTRD